MKFSKYNLLIPSTNNEQYILFNTYKGSCFEVDNSVANIINETSLDALNVETKELFELAGVIIPDEVNEQHMIAYNQNYSKYNNPYHTSTILLTWDCNLKCTYCYQETGKNKEYLTMDRANRYIDFMLASVKQSNAKSVSIYLFGGEPLMNIEVGYYILEKIKSYCEANNIIFSSHLITNGTLLTTEDIARLYLLNCRTIQITLDGLREVHDKRKIYVNGKGSFDEIMSALHILNERNDIRTTIRVNIDKKNIMHTRELLDYIGKNGEALTNCDVFFGVIRNLDAACFNNSTNCLLDSEINDVLYSLWNYAEKQGFKHNMKPRRRTLHCGTYYNNTYTVTPELDVYKCVVHAGVKEHLMGRIDEYGHLVDLTPAFYEWMTVDPFKNDSCKVCVYLPNCGGGCGVMAYNEAGTYQAKGCYQLKDTLEREVVKFARETVINR